MQKELDYRNKAQKAPIKMRECSQRKDLNFFCSLLTTLRAPALPVCTDECIWLKGLHSAHPTLSDADTLFIRWAFPFNATLQPPEGGKQCDYNPDFGLSRRVVYSHHSAESPKGSRVSFKHRLILNWDSHASHLLVKLFMCPNNWLAHNQFCSVLLNV